MNAIFAKLGMIAIVLLMGFLAGIRVEAWRWDAAEKARVEAARKEEQRLKDIAFDIGQALGKETIARQDADRKHRAEIEQWKTKGAVYVQESSGLKPLAEATVRFGPDYVDLWNDGLCLAAPDRKACHPRRADGAALAAHPVTPGTLLGNTEDNAQSCGADRARLAAWQELARKSGWVK